MSKAEENNLSIPNEFPFPYPNPYDIQLNFMKSLYKTLELKRIGIFESPTGTVTIIKIKKTLLRSNM